MAVVVALGARPIGQASSIWPIQRSTLALRARVESAVPVMATTGTFIFSSCPRSRVTSAVSPPYERIRTMSSWRTRPRSPWTASAACRKWLGVPVDASVAEIFWAMMPALPMPLVTTLPLHR